MFHFAHGDHHEDEIIQAASQSDHTGWFVIGSLCLFVALILLSRYRALRPRK